MHEATYAPASAIAPASSGIAAQGSDVVDEHRARLQACRATSAFEVSIETGSAGEPLDHRHDASQLLLERDRLCSGPRRLAADVEQIRALGKQPPGGRGRDVGVEVVAHRRRSCRA